MLQLTGSRLWHFISVSPHQGFALQIACEWFPIGESESRFVLRAIGLIGPDTETLPRLLLSLNRLVLHRLHRNTKYPDESTDSFCPRRIHGTHGFRRLLTHLPQLQNLK